AASRRVADDVLSFARKTNVTHIIVGKSERSRWFEILHGSVVHDLVRRAGNISVHVIPGESSTDHAPAQNTVATDVSQQVDPLPYIVALFAVAAALGVSILVRPLLGLVN